MGKFRIAAVQMVSAPDVAPNLETAGKLIAAAAAAGARLAALPENFYIIGRHEGDKVKVREKDGSGPIQDFLSSFSKKNHVWVLGGTVPIECNGEEKIRSARLLYDDSGRRAARYDKIHVFKFESGDERYDEARTGEPGGQPRAVYRPFRRPRL